MFFLRYLQTVARWEHAQAPRLTFLPASRFELSYPTIAPLGFLRFSQHSLSFALGSYPRISARHIVNNRSSFEGAYLSLHKVSRDASWKPRSQPTLGPQELAQYPFLFIPTIRPSPGSDGGAKEIRRQHRLNTCAHTSHLSSWGQVAWCICQTRPSGKNTWIEVSVPSKFPFFDLFRVNELVINTFIP
jgi:hypothetical protein